MNFDDAGGTSSSTILPSNSSYRPTQGAIRHSEDTEFNDALRARGILPPKADNGRSPSPDLYDHAAPTARDKAEAADLDDDDDLLDLEDDIPQHILEKYRESRLQEVQKIAKTSRFGSMIPIGRDGYTREVTEASKQDIEQQQDMDESEFKGKGTGVVCFLWKDSVPESHLLQKHLEKLAASYPSTKFVSIRGDMCIANYPDKNIPTMLLYRRGQLVKQIIGLRPEVGLKGMQTTAVDVEALLTICDIIDPFLKAAPTTGPTRQQDGDSSDEDHHQHSKIRKGVTVSHADDDDELDL